MDILLECQYDSKADKVVRHSYGLLAANSLIMSILR